MIGPGSGGPRARIYKTRDILDWNSIFIAWTEDAWIQTTENPTSSMRIAQIIGPVVDVQCTSDATVDVVVATSLSAGKVTVEVLHLMGD